MKRSAAVLLLAIWVSGCSKQVLIRTSPAGARVKVDNRLLGKAPVAFTDNGSTGRTYVVEISKPGYETLTTTLTQQWDSACVVGSVVGGLLCLFPFAALLVCAQVPNSQYDFELERASERAEGESDAAPIGAHRL